MFNLLLKILFMMLIFGAVSMAEDDEAFVIETVGKISKNSVSVYSNPDELSKKLYTLRKDDKVVVLGEVDEKWLKVKFSITKIGYIKKDSIDFISTLKKELIRGNYYLTKLNLDINALIERFNINLTESAYFQQEGIVPQLKLLNLKNKNNILEADILYTFTGTVETDSRQGSLNPFYSETLSLMEVIFFKMFLMEEKIYRINILINKYDKDKKSVVNYCSFEYKHNIELFDHIKSGSGRIFEYVTTTMDIKEVFRNYP